jgi:cytochrome c peroxidase
VALVVEGQGGFLAARERFMHNGQFTKLRDFVAFYATRSTSPALWYPPGAKFDDGPANYRDNVNVSSLPYNRREGAPAPFGDQHIDAIVAFGRRQRRSGVDQGLTDCSQKTTSPS